MPYGLEMPESLDTPPSQPNLAGAILLNNAETPSRYRHLMILKKSVKRENEKKREKKSASEESATNALTVKWVRVLFQC